MSPVRFLAVANVAQQLDISPARVRELVHGGQLSAQRVGRELLVDADSVHRRAHIVRPAAGRPLSPRMAWGLLWRLSGVRAPWLVPAEHSRLRKYAVRLALEDWPRMLANRADVHRARMLPGPLKRLRKDPRAAVGGVVAAMHYGLDLLGANDDVELYVEPELFRELVDEKRINLAPEVPNVLIRVPRLSPALAFDDKHAGFAPPAAVAADLADAGDERSVRAARQLLAELEGRPRITFRAVAGARGHTFQGPDQLPSLPSDKAFATVTLPLALNWSQSGREYRLSDRSDRARVYEAVLREGGPQDVLTYVDGVLLIDLWNELVLPRDVRAAWDPLILKFVRHSVD
jgi:hypothetical protein